MYTTENHKQYAKVINTNFIDHQIAICYVNCRKANGRWKDIRPIQTAEQIAKALNVLEKIESINLDTISKKDLIQILKTVTV